MTNGNPMISSTKVQSGLPRLTQPLIHLGFAS